MSYIIICSFFKRKTCTFIIPTNADDHDEGHNFINIEEEEQEIDQAEIDETSDCDWQRRKNTDLTALREKERKIKLSLCPTMKD